MQRPDIPEDKIIFLDIDGVVNHELWYQRIYTEERRKEVSQWSFAKQHMDPSRVRLLNQLKPAKVVISSSWRYEAETVQGLLNAGLELEIIGGTELWREHEKACCRGNAIASWLEDHYGSVPRDQYFYSFGYLAHVTWKLSQGVKSYELNPNSVILNYVIFDDWDDMLLQQREHFIQVDDMYGLTQQNIEKAKTILRIL